MLSMNIEQKIMKAFGMDTANSNKVYLREKEFQEAKKKKDIE